MSELITRTTGNCSLLGDLLCRLCLSITDEQTLVFSSPTADVIIERIFQCSGVRLKVFPGMRPKICDVCISQLVICEKFIKLCRAADKNQQNLFREQIKTYSKQTVQEDATIPRTKHNQNEDKLCEFAVKCTPPKPDESGLNTTTEGKSAGDEMYMVEVVDTNQEYEIDLAPENIPDPNGCFGATSNAADGKATEDAEGKKQRSKKIVTKTQCTICGTLQQNLKQHMLVHTGEKKHVCPVCQKAFSQKGNLTHHMNHHTGNCPYRCDQCDKAFKDPQSLRSHKVIHTDERKFQCNVCEETFKYKNSLAVHLRCHQQDRRFSCSECQCAFVTSSALKKHTRTHTGERPYQCVVCEKSFKTSYNLNLHKLSHTKERRFQCDHCASWFSYKNVLKQHMLIHLQGDKPPRKSDRARVNTKKPNEG